MWLIKIRPSIIAATAVILFTNITHAQNNTLELNPHILRNYKLYSNEQLTAYRSLLPYFQREIEGKCGWKPTVYTSPKWQLLVLEADSLNYPGFNHPQFEQLMQHYKKQGDILIKKSSCAGTALPAWSKAIDKDIIGYAAALLILRDISDIREAMLQQLMPR